MKTKLVHFLMLTMLLSPVAALAASGSEQDQPRGERVRSRPQYEVKLTIHFLNEGRRVNKKEYSLVLKNDESGMIRMLKKVPGEFRDGKVEYLETGVKCDLKYETKESGLEMAGTLQVSAMPAAGQAAGARTPIEDVQCRFQADVVPGTPTIVARIDGLENNARWEIEVLATPVAGRQ